MEGTGELLQPQVKLMEEIPNFSLGAVTSDTVNVTYTGNGVLPLAPGDIIVGTEGVGFLRRVTGVQKLSQKANGDELVVTTETASITDAVLDGTLVLAEPITFDKSDFEKAGWKVEQKGLGYVTFQNWEQSGAAQVNVSGGISFDPVFTCELVIKGGAIERLTTKFEGFLDVSLGLDIPTTQALKYSVKESVLKKLGIRPLQHVARGFIGYLPVVIVTQLDLIGAVDVEFKNSSTVNLGFQSSGSRRPPVPPLGGLSTRWPTEDHS